MTIKEIVEKYLKDNSFGGLFNSDVDCGCDLGDLCPCGGDGCLECEPGYKRAPTGDEDPDCEFVISPDKPGAEPPAKTEET